ncbi:MAG: ATP-dependent DNA helicase RecG [Pseudomonadota bacterium]
MSFLHDIPIISLKGIGPKLSQKFNKLGLYTLADVLFFLPYKYQDRSHLVPISELVVGLESLTQGCIVDSKMIFARQRMLICHIIDEQGTQLTLRFFHFNQQQQFSLKVGQLLRCFGEIRQGRSGLEITHPDYQLLSNSTQPVEESYTPIYHQIQGLSQTVLRKLVQQTLSALEKNPLLEYLPEDILKKYNYPELNFALRLLHQPPIELSLDSLIARNTGSHQRLCFEELLAHQLSVRYVDEHVSAIKSPFKPSGQSKLQVDVFINSLPFELTPAQKKVVIEIRDDLSKPGPMLRLLQGDVGSGKTVVASITLLYAIKAGFQAVLMAPTELLAEQLYNNLDKLFCAQDVKIAYLSGRIKGKKRQQVLEQISSGEAELIIGTHALFQQQVEFERLALVVIDEQHRFGVHQRMSLRNKGKKLSPHLLVMTATPIPRTLAMTAYADLSCSIIDQLPPGRKAIKTVIVPQSRREELIDRIYQSCQQGKQCYWICTLIEESEVLQCQAAEKTYADLLAQLTGIQIGLVHGRMKNEQKSEVMSAFKNAQIQLLISTTVVEVGVDVPNASLMIIENAERLGLSQLHQLRGRVGRGSQQSVCVLVYGQPISAQGKKRLKVIRETNNGFEIAEQDLKIRGPGEFLGTRQTGLAQMKIADLIADQDLIPAASETALKLIKNNSNNVKALIHRWIGDKVAYKDA